MLLSIVVGTYNRLDQIRSCVQSIIAQTQTPFHLYVSDGGSTDGTIEYLSSISSETVHPIFAGKLIGQAKAYNDVFKQVETPYVCWLSDDNVVVNRGLDRAVRILNNHRKIGMVGLKVKDMQGPFAEAPYIGGISEIGILNVNQGVLRTEILKTVGGFSERMQNYGIDPDLTAKVLFSGHDLVYTRPVVLHHYRNWSSDRFSPEYQALAKKQERSLRLYSLKYSAWRRRSSFRMTAKQRLMGWVKKRSAHLQLIHSPRPFWGSLPRDWFNILNGRFISLFDPIVCTGRDFHLRQHCPRRLLPVSLPMEPEEL